MNNKLEASARIAFTALIHDIGKFLQRTKSISLSDMDKQLYCPQTAYGFSHLHAAYTSLAIDELENFFPIINGKNLYPFQSGSDKNIDDSIINAASSHHTPHTALQAIITVADRLSSAFERKEYDNYTHQPDSDNYITSRLVSPFDELDKETLTPQDINYVYPLQSLSPEACSPTLNKIRTQAEASAEYAHLWNEFKTGLSRIPQESQQSWAQWLDHFDTLWLTYTHAIPSASAFVTQNGINKTIADVSLYDHSKSTAALATALWQFYHDTGCSDQEIITRLKEETDTPFLIIQGDISGIQDFIFAQGAQTQADAAKLLRGRSFFISLLCECAALYILEELGLPSTSQIINAAGHFMIVATNTDETKNTLKKIKSTLEDWFYHTLYGTSNIVLAWEEARKSDFESSAFKQFQTRLHNNLERAKFAQMDLCSGKYPAVFENFLNHCADVCSADGRFPADDTNADHLCTICADIRAIGEALTKNQYLLISKNPAGALKTNFFGYFVQLTDTPPHLNISTYSRVWDISLPFDEKQTLFNGYARRSINAFVPKNTEQTILSFSDLVQSAEGKKALMALKGDIDNLGLLFAERIKYCSFASYAGLSRRINLFFTTILPTVCFQKHDTVYTVFAGGDDFFFIAPWDKQINYLLELKERFDKYVCSKLTFSVGMVMAHATMPIRILAELTEKELEKAKMLENKNGVCCFNQEIPFGMFIRLTEIEQDITKKQNEYNLSKGYIYNLIYLCEKAERAQTHPEDAIWRSWLSYRTVRHCESIEEARPLSLFFGEGIDTYKEKYKIPLFMYLYKLRNE